MTTETTKQPSRAIRPAGVRRANLGAVLERVRNRPMSRSELVEATGLTRTAIAGLVSELSALDLVVERAPASSGSPGRPSPVVSSNHTSFGVLTLEIAVDSIAAAVVGIDGTVLRSTRSSRPRDFGTSDATLDELVELATGVVESMSHDFELLGVSVAVAGLVRSSDRRVVVAPNLGWVDFDLVSALGAALHDPLGRALTIDVGNEADLGALAESRLGAGRAADHLLYITGEVGLGGSVVVDGRRLRGHAGFAGEVGHIPVNPNGSPCRCGSIGCWETEVGERVTLARAGIDPDSGAAGVDRLIRAAEDGERGALAAIGESGRWLGIGLSGLVNVLDPDLVVFGGIYARILPFARDALEQELERRRFRGVGRDIPIVESQFGADASLVGGADVVIGRLVSDPRGVVDSVRTAAASV